MEMDGQTVIMLPVVLCEALFMAKSPDRRLIEPGANMVNERITWVSTHQRSGSVSRVAGRAKTHLYR